ncbi:hypothetical protein MMCCUG48898_0222 [Mycobacteroides abscessus subsp. massiliense CCUG 48898 = JCM 15300]|nr:hypothetical protein MMCCUG48898_0222 [Mycobacteroides abscessus subsp. massiliense CCUG 48898 = JCM 15300]
MGVPIAVTVPDWGAGGSLKPALWRLPARKIDLPSVSWEGVVSVRWAGNVDAIVDQDV